MKTRFTILRGVFLSLCLTLYGPFSMANAEGGAIFLMEICADGVEKTVLFDADGNPVEAPQNCPECLTCCQTIGALVPTTCLSSVSFAHLDMGVDRLFVQNLINNKRNIYPAPRGPPALQFLMLSIPGLITFDRSIIGVNTRSDRRSLSKNADA